MYYDNCKKKIKIGRREDSLIDLLLIETIANGVYKLFVKRKKKMHKKMKVQHSCLNCSLLIIDWKTSMSSTKEIKSFECRI